MREKGSIQVLILIVILLVTAGFLGYKYFFTQIKQTEVTSIPMPSNLNVPDSIRIYSSLDRSYFLYINFSNKEMAECNFEVVNSVGQALGIKELLQVNTLPCTDNHDSILADYFIGWVGDNKLLLETKKGEVKVIDVRSHKVINTYTYDSESLKLFGASKTLSYWLFEKPEIYSFQVRDKDNNVVKDNINVNSNGKENYGLRTILYDDVNDGYLFVSGSEIQQQSSSKFDFLSMQDLRFRTLLKTEPITVIGRGCGTNKLSSEAGVLIYISDCVVVHKKYQDSDGNIRLPL